MRLPSQKLTLPTPDQALPGRDERMRVPRTHYVNGAPLEPPFAAGTELALFGLGCFWGAERKFWQTPGVVSTSVGYAGGRTPNPTYQEVCSGRTGHTEIATASEFYYAEDYHQQYLAKNPGGYCGIGGTGVACPVGLAATHPA